MIGRSKSLKDTKDALVILWSNARTIISNGELQLLPQVLTSDLDTTIGTIMVLDGITNQVGKDLL